jgi:hypothetical protein
MLDKTPRFSRAFARCSLTVGGLVFLGATGTLLAGPRSHGPDEAAADRAWQGGAIGHAQRMRNYRDADRGAQPTPPFIPRVSTDFDPTGLVQTEQSGGAVRTSNNAFFQSMGSNERTCFTCHQPQNGWSVSAMNVQARFYSSYGTDPIFRLADGAVCPSADVSTLQNKFEAYHLLLAKGLFRIALPMPDGAQFIVTSIDDPYDCNTNSATGLTGVATGIVSVYRRALPSTNLKFLSSFMWDGREPTLESQAIDATLGHAQANTAPTPAQVQQIVQFESGLVTAQAYDTKAKRLDEKGANGGVARLTKELDSFYIGINDPLGQNPQGTAFTPKIFDLFTAWTHALGKPAEVERRESIARGELLFDTTPIDITGVAGLNDVLNQPVVHGFCGTCHDSPNVGNHSVKAPLNIGVGDAGANAPPALDISDLPVFTLQCVAGPLAGQSYTVTDPGRALITGSCADIGKMKGPILRGLSSRAPYFHNGSADTLLDVVNFYDRRFNIHFSDQDKRDLVAFLQAL